MTTEDDEIRRVPLRPAVGSRLVRQQHILQPSQSPTTRVWPLEHSLAEVWLAGYGLW
jgi:hypothetical protein